jgi:hypothetical protein
MKTDIGTGLTSQLGRRKRKPLEQSSGHRPDSSPVSFTLEATGIGFGLSSLG